MCEYCKDDSMMNNEPLPPRGMDTPLTMLSDF